MQGAFKKGILAFVILLIMIGTVGLLKSSRKDESADWPLMGNDQNGSYYSNLTDINPGNADKLGFAWSYDMYTYRGQEATPIVIDGVMYTSGIWGFVYALDAASGEQLWKYDPKVPGQAGRNPCCDVVNRGIAVKNGKVYVASIDGRLHAIDARTGQKIWETDTIIDHTKAYSSTGGVQLAGRTVVIGNSGGDMDCCGVRGYVSGFDVDTGKLKWRFFTTPPAPGKPFEHPELAIAEKTWPANRGQEYTGGATVWDGISYDPELNLVYFGTGNGAPYDLRKTGDDKKDFLFVASILAVDADTGKMAWYYQETPGDRWDYDADQKMVLAELELHGAKRKVVMQASKNGFFYILDRKTGELLSAKNYAEVNWASGVDLKTGRPIVNDSALYYDNPKYVIPSWAGSHTWPPMSYNAKTGLVYIPVIEAANVWTNLAANGGKVKFINSFFTAAGIFTDDVYDPKDLKELFGPLPEIPGAGPANVNNPKRLVRELLRAWDPVNEKTAWEVETSKGMRGYDGGVMSTAAGLVFQGRGNGEFVVYSAESGKVLKSIQTGSHIMAAPMTYKVKGVQYVAVQAGYGGTAFGVGPIPNSSAALKHQNMNRIIVFKIGGGEVPQPPARPDEPFLKPPAQTASAERISHGQIKFVEQCSRCHAFGPSITPDLRKLNEGMHAMFKDIVYNGAVADLGMASFKDLLSESDVEDIHAYLIAEGWKGYEEQEKAAAKKQ